MSTSAPNLPVAIIGSSCRFPGAKSNHELWELLSHPRDLSQKVPQDRFAVNSFLHQDGSHHGTSSVAYSYFLDEDPRRFDASFFKISSREAKAVDPQGRLLLEATFESLNASGLTIENLRGSPIGVYVGAMSADYYDVQMRDQEFLSRYQSSGTARSILSNRISYFFDWKGPSLTIDTACSSSLVAVHLAVQARLRRRGNLKGIKLC